MPEVLILDYGVGNLLSLKIALGKAGFSPRITADHKRLKNADAVVLPGVGSFSAAVEKLGSLKAGLSEIVESGLPILGICLGLQLFFERSEEGPGKGLALFKGKSVKLPSCLKVPHMGWNTLKIIKETKILEGIKDDSYVYFVHSLYPVPFNKSLVCAETDYGITFASVIASENVFGTQFHPEKSGATGLRMLENFVKIAVR
jgi:glutamine amidotransferase